jgi:hypothetical protein
MARKNHFSFDIYFHHLHHVHEGLGVSGVIQMLINKTLKTWGGKKTNRNNNGGSVGKSYSHVHEG